MGSKKTPTNKKARKATAATAPAAEPPAPPAKPDAAEPKAKGPGALDAAARMLAEEGKPLSCQELVGLMAGKGYRQSPAGKTPAATLYSALMREIATKGEKSRFRKAGPGRFALNQTN